ncbi:MAG TPA: hypothetical protein PLC48_11970, partial [Ferruginibacter sp.]|nr:hypothetical protein [Ferruginibacter sp.]
MKKSRSGFYLLLATIVTFLSFFAGTISAQVTVTNPGNTTPGLAASYLTLADAITALNTQTAITGPVTITLDPGNPQTNPAGGYAITASLSGASAVNQVTITGSGNTITAPSPAGTAGALNDAIFKFIGADFMTLSNFVLNENAANTTTAAGTNNMVEWGVAVLYASTTNGAQNITIQNNTIDLNRTYQNSFGIYSNSTHSATAVTTNATATTAAGGNSGLKIYSNNITDVNNGIVIVGPTAAADQNTGVEIGGTALTANTLTNFGTTGTFSGYANVSGTVNGILLRNTNGFTVSFNSINSSVGGTTVGTLNGIQLAAASNAPTGTYTNNINSNVISLRSGLAGGAINGINIPSGSASATSTLNVNNNDFNTFGHTVSGTGIIIFILNASTFQFSNINSNTFTNITVNTTGNVTFISNSMNAPASGTKTVNSNSIVTAFSKTGAGGTVSLYTDGGSSTSTTAVTNNNNNFSNITVTGATTISGWFNNDGTSATPPKTITGNTFSNWTGGTSSISVLQSNFGGTANISNNTISNISGQSTITGLFVGGSGTIAALTMASNSITGLTSSGIGGTVTGISNACPATVTNINNNTLNGYSSTSSVVGLVNSGGTTANIFKNTICNLASSGVSSTVFGLSVTGGTTVNASNNRIADLRATAANAANPLVGMNLTGGTTINAYYNSVHLNGTSAGAAFGSSAVSASTSPTVNLRNNIFINLSTANTTGFTVAYRRSSTTLTSYAAASNNNIFYAGTPSASNLIYYDGTNSDQTIGAFKTRVSPRDGLSQTENVPFLSTACGNADFLKVNTATPTLAEGNGATIALFTDDFEGDIRNATTPDVGADEFSGIPIILVTINSVSASPSGNLCTAAARTITANTTAGGTTITSVTLNYSFNGVAQSPIAMTGGDPNTGQTSNWTAVIPVATPANAVVTWSVSAVDGITSKLSTGTSYQDEPLTGFTGSIAANLTTVCSGSPAILTATFVTTGVSKVLGAGSTTSTSTAASFFPGGWGGAKTQYIVKASELNTIGLAAGPITSLAFEATSSGQTYQGFTVQIGHTAATVMTTTFLATPMTQVYKGTLTDDGYTPIVGVNNLAFGTGTGSSSSFTWDGTSNLVISICWSRVPAAATATASSIRVDPAGFTCSAYDQTDNATPAAECATAAGDGTGSNRPKFTFVGNGSATLATVTWNDGTSNIGTGNPFTVNPTTTTTYSAIGTDANGCTVTSTGITINTIALPAGPSTGPSSQCGTGVPTVFASGTSDGNYRWYTVPSGGTAIPGEVNSVLGTYSISSTTTFYVAITNGTCESLRTPVLATVNEPDAV